MKYALIAVVITMLFAIQSAFAAESAFDIAAELIDAHELPENLPASAKIARKAKAEASVDEVIDVVADDLVAEESSEDEVASEVAAASVHTAPLESMDSINEESVEAPEQDERQPAAAENTMIAEAPGTIDFDMATIEMIPDELPEAKTNFKEIAKSK